MAVDERLLSLPFDHFERYALTSEICSLLRERPRIRVLDVGGHYSTLKLFLPDDWVILADPKEPPSFAYRSSVPFEHDGYLRALGGSLPFPDASFDVVTAHDTLEHVPSQARTAFIEDLVRVSRRFVIINGPIGHPEVHAAEERLARFWEGVLEWERHPLDEHFQHGLPEPGSVEAALQRLGLPSVVIPNGSVAVWLAMMAWQAYVQSLPEPESINEVFDRTFNAEVAAQDFGGVCYRTAFVVAKDPAERGRLLAVEEAFASRVGRPALLSDPERVERLVEILDRHARRVRADLTGLHDQVGGLHHQVAGLRRALAAADAAGGRRELRVRELDRELQEVHEVAADRERQIFDLRDAAAADRRALEGEIHRITGSATFRMTQGVLRRLRRWFPRGTVRGRAVAAIRRLVYRSLERRARRRTVPAEPPTTQERATEAWSIPGCTAAEYRAWISVFEPSERALGAERRAAGSLPYRPLVSVVVPVWNPPADLLRETVESVRGQTYDRWELCIAAGGSEAAVQAALSELAEGDDRVRIRFLDENRGISGNTAAALEMARGEFVGFLDHTDLLAPFALFRVVKALNRNPGFDVLYSDWDLLSADGRERMNPFFTPVWSPELLLSINYMAHFAVFRRGLVEHVGGLRSQFDGAQDWDLLLRVTELTDRVGRVPGILYHWRADPDSAAMSLEAKPEAESAQRRAVADALQRRGVRGEVHRERDGQLRIAWPSNDGRRVSVIIPTRHNRELLQRCLNAIAKMTTGGIEVLVVETAGHNEEREAWYEALRTPFPLRVLWWDEPFNYSAVNNLGATEAAGDVLLFLNDDTEPVSPGWLEDMVGWLNREGVGAVGAQLVGTDETIQHGGVVVGMGGFADHLFRGLRPGDWSLMGSTAWYRNVSAVTGACLAVTREVFEAVGGWDDRFILCGSDVELCLRIRRAGLRIVVTPTARVRHIERATRGDSIPDEDFCTSLWPYQPYVYGGDPYYNPNLSYTGTVPALRTKDELPPSAIVSRVIGRDLVPRPPADEQRHAPGLVETCRIAPADLEAVRVAHREAEEKREVNTVNWFIPDFENPFYGGIHTIFRFAEQFQRRYGVKNRFVVIGTGPESYVRSGLRATFPDLADSDVYLAPEGADVRLEAVPSADAAVATLWVTAYPMIRWHGADRFFYFVQDFEPMFYPAGALSALAEETYRMGLYGIANTPPLQQILESFGGRAVSFVPCVDTDVFHPRRPPRAEGEPLTVFMYGRPGHPRNCYELAVAALRRVKQRMGDRVRIVTAGSWAGETELEPWLDQLGLLDYRETADLYRRCDAGLVLSVSKHPTYIPLQLMACGALVVANDNPANNWLLRDGENALLADPTPDALAATLERGLSDRELAARLTKQAAIDIAEHHSDWESEIDRVHRFICDPNDL